jgi:hypothetical protein
MAPHSTPNDEGEGEAPNFKLQHSAFAKAIADRPENIRSATRRLEAGAPSWRRWIWRGLSKNMKNAKQSQL